MSRVGRNAPNLDTGRRSVSLRELLTTDDGWRVKFYVMTCGDRAAPQALVDHALDLLHATLPTPVPSSQRERAAFATLHVGETGDYLLIDWWEEDLLHHHLFGAQRPHDGDLRYGDPRGVCACVWEMAVLSFERDAWCRHVLLPRSPDLEGYLAERLEGTV
ncbi:MAG: hypothetical protein MPN21_02750 [Thermoanaerobaculia bacterium]|nr:hypothetical protein [Thermoanaerobaculia bacterium]